MSDLTGMDTGAGVRFLQYKNRVYGFNGRNRPRCFDGTAWTLMGIQGGIDLPQFTPSVAYGAAPPSSSVIIDTADLTSNVATITTVSPHGFTVGEAVQVTLTAGDSTFNGTFPIAAVTSTTFSYLLTHADIPSALVTGVAKRQPLVHIIKAVALSGTVTLTSGTPHNFKTGYSITFGNALYPTFTANSPFTITVTGSTTFTISFAAMSDGTIFDVTPPDFGMDAFVTGTTPLAVPTVITATYYYFVAPANSTKLEPTGRMVEGLPSALSPVAQPILSTNPTAGTVTVQSVTVGNIPSTHPDPQVDRWNIYRTPNGQFDTGLVPDQQDFFLLASVPIGTTSYVDSIQDASGWYINGTTFNRLRFNQNIPPTFKYAAMYGERMFGVGFDAITVHVAGGAATRNITTTEAIPDGTKGCWFRVAGDNAVYEVAQWTDANTLILDRALPATLDGSQTATIYRNPWEIWFSEFMSVEAWGPDGEGLRYKLEIPGQQPITGLSTFGGHLLIFTSTDIYLISGKGASRFDVEIMPDPVYSGLGAVSGDAIMRCDNEVHFLSLDGPAMVASAGGMFSPQLYGIELNTDWIDTLSAGEQALACCGTDGRACWYSVPVAGQVMNSATFRYERDKQSWWPETEMNPSRFVRQDLSPGEYGALIYIQGKMLARPANGSVDLIDAALVGTPTSVAATVTMSDSGATFPTSNGGLVECYIHFYGINPAGNGPGKFITSRRITANTSTQVTWSADAALPGSGNLGVDDSFYYTIGRIGWKWTSKSYDAVDPLRKTRTHLQRAEEVWATFYALDPAATLYLTDIKDGVAATTFQVASLLNLTHKYDIQKDVFEYGAILESNDGAVLKHLSIRGQVESENV